MALRAGGVKGKNQVIVLVVAATAADVRHARNLRTEADSAFLVTLKRR
jgi:hypothetical protein